MESAINAIPRDPRTDNISSRGTRQKEGQSADAEKKKSDAPYLPSSESVETGPAIISASIIREAPVARAKAGDESQRNLHARRCKKSYRTENMEYFIHSDGG